MIPGSVYRVSSLPRSTPEAHGLSAAALDAFIGALDASEQEIQTLILVRHGHVVLEAEWSPYRLTDPHFLFSLSKSFTSTAVGLAVEAGLLTIDDKVVSFFEEELPEKISDNLAAMRIRDLLTMTTGHHEDTFPQMRGAEMTRTFFGFDVEHEPGTYFVYNTGATYILAVILQKLTGELLLDYLKPRLLEPLGATEAIWEVTPEGVNTGGTGLSLNTESLANFGQLLLQQGQWEGRQLVPAEWIAAATSKQVPNDNQDNPDWKQGYGFQFWQGRHGTYRGDGAFGQYCVLFPDQDAVLVITSASSDMQEVLNLVWEHLLPTIDGAAVADAVVPKALEILPPSGPAPAGGDGRTYRFEPNQAGLVAVRLDPDGTGTFSFESASVTSPVESGRGATYDVVCEPGDWREAAEGSPYGRLLTSAYGDGDVFVATLRYVETPYVLALSCRPEGDALIVDCRFNVGFGPTTFTLTAHA
jgi:CubicO group peptidase (beta-lactamase class C family)